MQITSTASEPIENPALYPPSTQQNNASELSEQEKEIYLFLHTQNVTQLKEKCKELKLKTITLIRAPLICRTFKFISREMSLASISERHVKFTGKDEQGFMEFCNNWPLHSSRNVPTKSYTFNLSKGDVCLEPKQFQTLHNTLLTNSHKTTTSSKLTPKENANKMKPLQMYILKEDNYTII